MTREILFAMALPVSLLFTIGTLQLYRGWLVMAGYDHPETAARPGWLLGAAFLVMVLAGLVCFAFGTSRFLSVSFFVCGSVGGAVLADTLFKFYGGRLNSDHEMRKVLADDL